MLAPEKTQFGFPLEKWHALQKRLRFSNIAPESADQSWKVGPPRAWISDLIEYWANSYDWQYQQEKLNNFPHYTVRIKELNLHFIWLKSAENNSTPLLLLHGWPGSFMEFTKVAAILSDRTDPLNSIYPFDLIIPSLPGFGLSVSENNYGYSLPDMADIFHTLMYDALGYAKYMVQGGDLGSFVGSMMAQSEPERIIGLHLNFLPIYRDADALAEHPDPTAQKYRKELSSFLKNESAYQLLHSTKPQTLTYALYDSPIGLAAWISEKFSAWSDTNNLGPGSSITRDELLTNITYYWLSGTIGSSIWPYYARALSDWPFSPNKPINVSMGYSEFPREIFRPPIVLAKTVYKNILLWTSMEAGGHFAALEQPTLLANHIRTFLRKLS